MSYLDLDKEADDKDGNKKIPISDSGPGPIESGIRGFVNAATFGTAPNISAAVNTGLGKIAPSVFGTDTYSQRLKDYLAANRQAEASHPVASLVGSAPPAILQALATGGSSLARQGAVNAAMGAVNAAGSSDLTKPGEALKNAAMGGTVSGALAGGPGLALKGISGAANAVTKTDAARNVERILTQKAPGWKQELEKIIGTTDKDFKYQGTDIVKEAKNFIEAVKEPGRVNQYDTIVKDAIKAGTPSMGAIAADTARTIGKGVVGSAATGGLNYLAGGPVDPMLAAGAGALAGARSAQRLTGEVGTRLANKLALSDLPEKVAAAGATRLGGAANQFVTQAASKDISERAGGATSPFGKLTDYLSQAQSATNPRVQQAAEQAQEVANNAEDPDAKRKASMILQGTPEGRAVGNSASPYRDLDLEAE